MKTMQPTVSAPLYVVDASVAVKWHLLDEQDSEAAVSMLTDFRDGRIKLVAPEHIRYEISNALRAAVRTRRLTPGDGAAAVAAFLSWQLPTVSSDGLIAAAFELSIRFGCSFYDGLYLALAESAGCPLVHADNRPRNTLGTGFPLAVWVGDYQFLG